MDATTGSIRHRSPLFVAALTILTLGIYVPVWFIRSWSEMRQTGAKGMIHPALHALGLLVPGVSLYRTWRQAKASNAVCAASSSPASIRPWTVVVQSSLAGIFMVFAPSGQNVPVLLIGWLLGLAMMAWLMIRVQSLLNGCLARTAEAAKVETVPSFWGGSRRAEPALAAVPPPAPGRSKARATAVGIASLLVFVVALSSVRVAARVVIDRVVPAQTTVEIELSELDATGRFRICTAPAQVQVSVQPGDRDGDGLADNAETAAGTDFVRSDSDHDFLLDGDELNSYCTSPTDADTDRDGFIDGYEVRESGNPLDSRCNPTVQGCARP